MVYKDSRDHVPNVSKVVERARMAYQTRMRQEMVRGQYLMGYMAHDL